MPNPSQKLPASSKSPNKDLKEMDVLCTFKIKIESQNLDHGYIKDQWPYPIQDQDAKPHSGTSSVLQSPKWGLKGHGCSLHLQNQEREPKFRIWVKKNQWPYQNQYKNAKPQSGTCSILQTKNKVLKDMYVLCPFKIKVESQNLEQGTTKDHWLYTNQYQNKYLQGTLKPQIRTSRILILESLYFKNGSVSNHGYFRFDFNYI